MTSFRFKSFFLLGPRGTGKSTLMKRRFLEALVIDLLWTDVRCLYTAHPERLRQTIIIDEVQKVVELLSVVYEPGTNGSTLYYE